MSHHTGKLEITGLTDAFVTFRYHRAADPSDDGRTLICHRNPDGYWLDDFMEIGPASEESVSRSFGVI